MQNHRPTASAQQTRIDPNRGAEPLAYQSAQRETAIGAFPGQNPLDRARRADERKRSSQHQRHRHKPRVAEYCRQTQAGCRLDQRRPAAGKGRTPERAAQRPFVHRGPLHDGVGKQCVHRNPKHDIHRRYRGADPKLRRSDKAGDDKGGDDRQDRRNRSLQPRPECVAPHAPWFIRHVASAKRAR